MINTIFEIGYSNNVLSQFHWLPSFYLTFWTPPCLSAKISTMCAIGQWFWWCKSSSNRTISPVWKFLLFFDHFWHCCRVTRNFLHHLFQNYFVICFPLLHCLWQYISAHPNSPGGGITTLVFIVSILEGHIGLRLLPSLNSSVISSQELSTTSTDIINVVRASPFLLIPFVLSSDDKM